MLLDLSRKVLCETCLDKDLKDFAQNVWFTRREAFSKCAGTCEGKGGITAKSICTHSGQ